MIESYREHSHRYRDVATLDEESYREAFLIAFAVSGTSFDYGNSSPAGRSEFSTHHFFPVTVFIWDESPIPSELLALLRIKCLRLSLSLSLYY